MWDVVGRDQRFPERQSARVAEAARASPEPNHAGREIVVRIVSALFLAACVALVVGGSGVGAQTTVPYPTMLIRCTVASPEMVAKLRLVPHVDILDEVSPVHLEALVFPTDLPLLKQLGVPFTVVHPDIEAFFASRLTDPGPLDIELGSMGGFYTLSEVVAKLDSWRQKYPSLITARTSLGKTVENRDQWMVKISDNPDVDENEPEIYIETLIHAREPAGLMSMMRCVEYMLENYGKDPMITDLVNNREIYYVPVMNADGYEYNRTTRPNGGGMWRKNRYVSGSTVYGVDLNRNWGYKWGYDNNGSSPTPSSTTYRGPSAFSEPETQHVRDFVNARTTKGMTTAWDIHTYSGLLMWPFGYANVFSPRHNAYQEITQDMAAKNNYTTGQLYSTIYAANGTTVDWYEGGAGLWAWTPEIGHRSPDNFWPPTSRILELAEENLHMLLTGIQYAGPYLLVKSRTITEVGNNNGAYEAGEKIQVTCTVRNRGVVTATNATAKLETTSDFVVIETGSAGLGTIPTVTDANNNATPLVARLLSSTPPGTDLRLDLVVEFNGHQLRFPLDVIAGPGTVVQNDPCEVAGWMTGLPGDTAVRGKWTWGDPYATYATSNRKFLIQTGDDHTTGTGRYCYVTGNTNTTSADTDDVDAGYTTLLTTVFDLSGAPDPWIEYWRWYADHGQKPNNDVFVVSVTNDNGASWKDVERVTYTDTAWTKRMFRLRDYVKPTAQVQLRFVAQDQPDDSYCEALVDDLTITSYDDGVRLTLSGSTKIGQTALLDLTAARSTSRPYVLGASFGDQPGIAVPGPRMIPLEPDALFYSFWVLPEIFKNFSGSLSASGTAQAQVAIPDLPLVVGTTMYTAFVTLDPAAPGGMRDISASRPITFTAK